MRGILHSIKNSKRVLIATAASLVISFSVVAAPAASALSVGGPSDCDNNAIINCGAHSSAAVMSAYQGKAYIRAVYAYFGISNGDIANLQATNVSGRVTKDGTVFVDGQSKAVATNAMTAGQASMPGSTRVNSQGAVFFVRPPSVSFQQASLPAFVAMQNGQFQFAIIASCGNPVKATPVTQPKQGIGNAQAVSKPQAKPTPKATPAPTPTQTQTQFQTQSQSQRVDVTNSNTTNVENNTTTTPAQPVPTPVAPVVQTTAETQPAAQPTSLVNTGPAGLVGVFLVSSAVGAFGFRRFLAHRLAGI